MKLGLIQMTVTRSKKKNLIKADQMIAEAAQKGAEAIVLPEMFNCPYDNRYFSDFAENEGEETFCRMASWAFKHKVFLVGGSIPEKEETFLYNTSYIFDEKGRCIGKHRKAHLFDIDVKDKIRFKESDILTAGNRTTVVDSKFGKIGICICYDIRFPEFARKMTLEGAQLILVPGAFNMTTGPAHWQLTARARALDNQVFYGLCSPARVEDDGYTAYGHSLVTNPWGQVIQELDSGEGILIQEIDLEQVHSIRDQLPLLKHRKTECY